MWWTSFPSGKIRTTLRAVEKVVPESNAQDGHRHCLIQKLSQDVHVPTPDGKPDSDLAGAFSDGHQHDIHDADPPNDQRYSRHRREQQG
jgi:hypothetical protein